MKKLMSLIVAFALLVVMLPIQVNAAEITASGTCGENLDWKLTIEGALVISGAGTMKNYSSSYGVPWYSFKDQIKSVVIENGVTSIGDFAFRDSDSLREVNIPKSVTTIGKSAFSDCFSLIDITIPSGVTVIGEEAFYYCTRLSEVHISENVTSIYTNAFDGCWALSNVVYCGTNTQWKSIAVYYGNDDLLQAERQYHDWEGVSCTEQKTCSICGKTESGHIWLDATCSTPKTCSLCGKTTGQIVLDAHSFVDTACEYCGLRGGYCGLYEINGGTNLTWTLVGDTLTFSGVGGMRYFAFTPWSYLDDQVIHVVIEDGVTNIAKAAFYSCEDLSSIIIGNSVTSVGFEAFYGCTALHTVVYCGTEEQWNSIKIDSYNNNLTDATRSYHDYPETFCNNLRTCTICGETSKLDHTEVTDDAVAATCTATGKTEGSHCSVCDTVIVAQQTVPAKGHIEVTDAAIAATCTATGKTEGKHCSVCGTVTVAQQTVPAKGHTEVVDKAVAATCTAAGKTEGKHCSVCGVVTVAQQNVPATGHTYDNGVDGTCNVCGIHRETTENRTVMHMFRMYDPNSGEHFYTGSEVERENLVAAGWNYEGVGFTFSRTTGLPVYRLYDPITGEHLYTMSEEEKAMLMAQGWNFEGIAFNSAYDTEVPQYRLHNPNATRGAYHFTASLEERDYLISIGWEDQGIGFYSSWK